MQIADTSAVVLAYKVYNLKVYKKGLRSRSSATASLLIESNYFTEEKTKLVVVGA